MIYSNLEAFAQQRNHCCCSNAKLCLTVTQRTAACQASLSITNFQSLLKLMAIESVMPSNHLVSVIPFSFCPQSFPASRSFPMSRHFISDDQNIWSFSFSINPSNDYLGLISFKIDGFDLFAVQGTLKSLL